MVSTPVNTTITVGILIESNFEDSEFKIPYTALKQTNAKVVVLGSRMNEEYKGKRGKVSIKPDATATEVRAEDFDAIIIPGGAAPDKIRANPNAVRLVMNAMALNKIVAAVCHGPQVLIEADQLRGRQATGFRAIRKDMQNAGANYVNEPVVVDGNLITARQPGDLPIFTTVILTYLGLTIEDTPLPELSDTDFEWWKLAEAWGGSSRNEIIDALNTSVTGENYTLKVFQKYREKVSDPELQVLLQEICTAKENHIEILKKRFAAFDQEVTWQEFGSEAFANLQSWLQSSDDMNILRRALGDIQTGVLDSYHLCGQISDPQTVNILMQIEDNLAQYEERLGDLYRARQGVDVQPPIPTTFSLVA